ncbi:MAG: hypothetical protein JXJ04_13400 [Spirochaetales bacterium]|nr:hypothetical protein [Spirochaetales bacterium]
MKLNILSIIVMLLSAVIISGCNKSESIQGMEEVKAIKPDAPVRSNLFYFSGGKNIIGIDPVSDTVVIDIAFKTYVAFGDISEDNRLFILDNGKQPGVWGEQVFVLNEKGQLLTKLKTYPNPLSARISGNHLIVTNGSYTKDGRTGLDVFDINTYNSLAALKEIGEIVTSRDILFYKNKCIIAVNPFTPLERPGYLFSINLDTMEKEYNFAYTIPFPADPYDILFKDNNLVILFSHSYQLFVYDYEEGKILKKIDITELTDLPEQTIPGEIEIASPVLYDEDIVLIVKNRISPEVFQKVLVFDSGSFELKREVMLDREVPVSFTTLRYVAEGKLYFEGGGIVSIFDYTTGLPVRQIEMNR